MATAVGRIFISWEPSNSRSATLAEHFQAPCFNVHYLGLKRPVLAPFKYVMQSFKTWALLHEHRPKMIFIQNPPTFAPLAVWLYCVFSDARFIIDSHTGVFLERKWKWLSFLHSFLVRRAVASIVTNEYLAEIVRGWGGEVFIFPDVPTEFPDAAKISDKPEHFLVVVNSFSYDEPLAEILDAAARCPQASFAITGDTRHASTSLLDKATANVRFTGFVSRKEYVDTLHSADAAIVLTTEDHTMQRGAYEAMSLGVPIITSNWPLLANTFFKGSIHTDNTADAIKSAIGEVLDNKEQYKLDVADLKRQRRQIWSEKLSEFSQAYLTNL